jgi:flagellar hook-associated protein 1 FlgK
VAGLVDDRNRLIDRVAASLPVRVDARDDGSVILRTASGLTLVDRTAREISFSPSPLVTPNMSFSDGAGALSGLSLSGIDITPGGTGVQRIEDGALAAAFALRDADVPAFQERIDSLAAELAFRLDEPAIDGTRPPGAAGIFAADGAAITPGYAPGLARDIELNPLLDPESGNPALLRDGLGSAGPGPAGADALPRAFLKALDAAAGYPLPGAATEISFTERVASAGEAVSTARVSAETRKAEVDASRATLAAVESERLGVDTDAELQELLVLEQAYAANARVIEVASRMLDDITGVTR